MRPAWKQEIDKRTATDLPALNSRLDLEMTTLTRQRDMEAQLRE